MTAPWDVVVIGAGPAGLVAAAAVARGGLRCLCLDRMGPGGLLINLGPLHECRDLPVGTTGPDHIAALTEKALEAGVEIGFGEVQSLRPGGAWTVATDGESYTARAVIIATGLGAGGKEIPGAADYEGRGVSHCAACDGPLYAGAPVVVTGVDRWALQEALELAEIAAKVTIAAGPAMPAADDPRARRLASLTNVDVVAGAVVGLAGAEGLESVLIDCQGQRSSLPARALFAYSQRRPELDFAAGLLTLDANQRIRVDEARRAGASFLFAAGDVRADAAQSVAAAEEDGRRAAEAALRALAG